jgi:hypothetical protein
MLQSYNNWLTANYNKLSFKFHMDSYNTYFTFPEFLGIEFLHYTQPSRTYR